MSDAIVRILRPDILDEIPSDAPAVIEASAGTGKTFTLEHLVLEMMLVHRITISKILVVTYTERATNELRQRIRAMLEGILTRRRHVAEPDPNANYWELDDDAMRFVERQLFTFDRAPIHTIHGFCHRILAENAFHLRRLFDQEHQDARTLFEDAFRQALRRDLTTDPLLAAYTRAWFELSNRDALEADLFDVCDQSGRILPGFDEEKLLAAIEAFRAREPDLAGVYAQLERLFEPRHTPSDVRTVMSGVAELFERLDAVREPVDIPPLLVALDPYVKWMRKAAITVDDPTLNAALYVLFRLAPLRVAALQQFRPVVQRHLAQTKESGRFDFDDMLEMVWSRLDADRDNESPLLGYLRDQYRVALIDEFQDTDPVQWNIFRTVFFESAGRNGIYLIGDPKQAIYGFRGADVRTYIAARRAVEAQGALVPLRQNFRSTERLIAGYNTIFDQSAEEPFFDGPIRYDHPVTCGRPELGARWANGDEVVPIEIVRPVADRLFASRARDAIGDAYAEEIARILSDEGALYVTEGESERRVTAKNIFILTHANWEGDVLSKALRKHGVPHAFYKQEGLFQTNEAHDILDLLAAVESPYDRSKRQAAWITPFFEVALDDLPRCRDLPETHPLFARLVEWHDLAERHEFERLFTEVMEHSGVVRRAIFLGENDRELTNIQHIFEVLLEEVNASRFDLRELLNRLQAFIAKQALPRSDDRNVQRLESDEEAVQIMTVHKSKGLEADVVFLFGGLHRSQAADIHTCHVGEERVLHVGAPYLHQPHQLIEREFQQESQRLLYVAATRARARLYLPYIDRRDLKHGLSGRHEPLNARLRALLEDDAREPREAFADRFRVRIAPYTPPDPPSDESPVDLTGWAPDPRLFDDHDTSAQRVRTLREAPLIVTSYSRMKRTAKKANEDVVLGPAAFRADLHVSAEAWRDEDELPGGAAQGIFLHALLEHAPPKTFAADSLETWRTDASVVELFDTMMRDHGIDPRYRAHCERMVWNTMHAPISLPDGERVDGLWTAPRVLHEVEYFFPIPEAADPHLDELVDRPFKVERGFIKGYVDVILEFESGKVYFADWKSDTLESYDDASLAHHVEANYGTQARLYSLAVARMFGLHDRESFDARFGGYIYAFLRGADGEGAGFHIHRPHWDDLLGYERELVAHTFT